MKKLSGKQGEYSGILAEPITVLMDEAYKDNARRAFSAADAKLPALAAHYGVNLADPAGPLVLASRLAYQHVPGFQLVLKKPSGRPKKKTAEYHIGLHFARFVEAEINGREGAASRAAQKLAESEEHAKAKREKRRANRNNVSSRKLQIETDMSGRPPIEREIMELYITGILAGVPPAEVAEKVSEKYGLSSHKIPPEK
jgi:hypothetical protein